MDASGVVSKRNRLKQKSYNMDAEETKVEEVELDENGNPINPIKKVDENGNPVKEEETPAEEAPETPVENM